MGKNLVQKELLSQRENLIGDREIIRKLLATFHPLNLIYIKREIKENDDVEKFREQCQIMALFSK